MADYKDYLYTLNSCDADTIYSVFDVSLLRELYFSVTRVYASIKEVCELYV